MVGCKRRERCTHRIPSYVSWTKTDRLTTGQQIGNGDEVTPVRVCAEGLLACR